MDIQDSTILMKGNGVDLERAVSSCFRSLGFRVLAGTSYTHDLLATSPTRQLKIYSDLLQKESYMNERTVCVVEITGSTGNIEVGKVRQLADWVGLEIEQSPIDHVKVDNALRTGRLESLVVQQLKGLLVSNWNMSKPIEQRFKTPYSKQCIEFAKRHDLNLLLSPDLRYALEEISEGLKTQRKVRDLMIGKSGFTVISEKMKTLLSSQSS
jgi:hypothetical protein